MLIKQISLVVCTLMLFCAGAHAQTPVPSETLSWKAYTIKGEAFSVQLPTHPAMHTTEYFNDRARKNVKIRQLGAYADGVVYTIYIFDNPVPRQSLDQFVARLTTGRIWDRSSGRDINLDGFAGKAFASMDRASGMSQAFAVDGRLYEFAAFGVAETDPRVQKFLSSITLRKKENSVEVSDGQGVAYEPVLESGAANWAAGQKIHTGREVNTKVRLAMKPEPGYTEAARRNRVTGTVVLRCTFSSNGSITNIWTVTALPDGLTEKAIDAARKIKFIPAMKDGHYVSMWMQLEYNFTLY
jgi:TonB family protein